MTKVLKINIAFVLCASLFFRLFFLSIDFISPNSKWNKSSEPHLTCNSGHDEEAVVECLKLQSFLLAEIEVSEKDCDDENESKDQASHSLGYFSSHFIYKLSQQTQAVSPSNKHFAFNSTRRYLEFRVFRI